MSTELHAQVQNISLHPVVARMIQQSLRQLRNSASHLLSRAFASSITSSHCQAKNDVDGENGVTR